MNINKNKYLWMVSWGWGIFLISTLLVPARLSALTCTSRITGNWDANTTWMNCAGGSPGVADTAIVSTQVVTLNISTTVAGLVLSTPTAAPVQLNQSANTVLTVNGSVTIYRSSNAFNCGWNINSATSIVSGVITYASTRTNTQSVSSVTVTTGELDANGGLTFVASTAPSNILLMTGSTGLIKLKGALSAPANSSSFTATNGTFNYYDNVAAQTISSFSAGGGYFNLYLNNTSASGATMGFSVNTSTPLVMGDLRVQSGTLKNGGFSITGRSGKTFEVANGSAFEMSASTGFPTGFGTTTLGPTSTVRYLQTATPISLSTDTLTYGNLELKPAGTAIQNFSSNTVTIQGNLTIGDGANTATVSANASSTTLIVNGSVIINSNATLIAPSSNPVTVGGNWTNSGLYTSGRSTVTLTGAAPQLTGSTTFYSLKSTVANQTITVLAKSTVGVTGFLTLTGSSGNEIKLRSSTPSTPWYLINTGVNILSFVDAQDSNGLFGTMLRDFPNGIDSGNNFNWAFTDANRYWASAGLAVWNSSSSWSLSSGGSAGASPPISSHTVVFNGFNGTVGIASVTSVISISTLTMSSGYTGSLRTQGFAVTITSNVSQSGGTILLTTSAVTLQGDMDLSAGTFTSGFSTVTLSGTKSQTLSTIPGMDLSNLIVLKGGGTASLGSDLVLDGNLTSTLGTLDTTGSNYSLTVASSVLINGGTLTLNTSTVSVAGGWTRTSGTFNANSSTVTFTGPGSNFINPGLVNFNHVVFNGSNSTWTLSTNGLFTNGHVTLQDGILTTGANINITDGGDFVLSGGTFSANSSSMSVAGNWTRTGSVFNAGNSTVTLTDPTAVQLTGSTTFYGLKSTVAAQTITAQAGSTVGVTGFLTLTGSSGNEIKLRSSTPSTPWYLINTGTNSLSFVDARDSNGLFGRTLIDFNGGIDSGNNFNWAFNDNNRYWASTGLAVWNSTSSWSLISGGYPGASPPISSHTVILDGANGYVGISSVNATINISTLTITSGYTGSLRTQGFAVTITSNVSQSGGTILLTTSAVTLQGDMDLSAGTFTSGFSTVTLSGTKSQTLSTIPGMDLSNLIVLKGGGTASLGSDLVLDGNLTSTLGTLDTTGSNYSLTVASSVLINGGTLTLNTSTVSVAGGWTRTSGTFNANSSTVTFTGPGSNFINPGLVNFNHVVFNGSNSTWTLSTNGLFTNGHVTLQDGILTTGANINITDGGDFVLSGGTFSANSSSMSVAGNWTRTGSVFNAGNSTVTLTDPTAVQLTGSTTFYGLKSTVAAQTITAQAGSTVGVTGFLTLTGSSGNEIKLRSSTPSTPWYLINTGTNSLSFVDARDSNGLFGRTLIDFNGGIDSGNNFNWAFNDNNRYWASTGLAVWNSTSSWSLISGGYPGASPPISSHTVILDGANGYVGISSVNATINISTLTITSGYTGSLRTQGFAVTITSNVSQSGGTILLTTSAVTLQGDMDLSAGTFTSGFSTVTLSGTKSQTLSTIPGMDLSNLIVLKGGGTASLGSDLVLDGNLTSTLGTLDTTGSNYSLTVASSVLINGGTLTLNTSTVSVAGGWTRTSGTFNANSSTVTFTGPGSNFINPGLVNFNHVVFNGSNSTWTLSTNGLFTNGHVTLQDGILTTGANINITDGGDFVLSGGTFSANSSSMSVAGNWTRTGSVFNAGNSTVTLTDPTAVQLTGSTTFYGLKSTVAAQTITAQAGSTVGVTGFLTLTGSSGNEIKLRSSTPSTPWYLINTGTNSLSFVDARDSNGLFGRTLIDFNGGIDSGNNFNWAFNDNNRYWASTGLAVWNSTSSWSLISGGYPGASPPISSHTVILDGANGYVGISSVNATINISTLTITSGYTGSLRTQGFAVTITSNVSQSGGTILLTTSAVTLQGDMDLSAGTFTSGFSTVTLSGTKSQTLSTIPGMDLSNLIVLKGGGTASLGSDLVLDGNLTSTLGTLDTTGSNYSLTVASSVLINGGTLTLNTSTVSVAGGWTRTSGTFNANSSTVTFTGPGSNFINPGLVNFNHVVFNGSNSTWTLSTNGLFTNGHVTLQDGILTTGANINITDGGDFVLSGGTFSANSSSMSVAGNWTRTGSVFNAGNSTVTLTDPTAVQLTGSTTFYGLKSTVAAQTITAQAGSTVGVTGFLTLTGSSGNEIKLRSSTPSTPWYLINTGTNSLSFVDARDSNGLFGRTLIDFNGGIDSGNNFNWAFTDANRYWASAVLAVWNSSSSWSLASGGTGGASPPASTHTVVLDGANGKVGISSVNVNVNISSLNVLSGYTGSLNTQGFAVTLTGALIQSGGTLNSSSSAVTLQGDMSLSGGTFTNGSSTVSLSGTNIQTLSSGGSSHLENMILNKSGGSAALASDLAMDGNFTLTAGTFTTSANGYHLSVASNAVMSAGSLQLNASTLTLSGNWSYTGGSLSEGASTLELTGSFNQSLSPGTTSFNNLTVNKTGGILSAATNLNLDGNYRQVAGTFQPGARILTINGNWTNEGGSFIATGSTVIFNGSGTKTLTGSTTFQVFRSTTTGALLRFDPSSTIAVTQILDLKNVTLRSTSPGNHWGFNVSGTSVVVQGLDVQDSDASSGVVLRATGTNSGNNLNWDFGPPSAVSDLDVSQSTTGASIHINWTAPGEDALVDTLINSTFTIQYTTVTTFAQSGSWSPTGSLPTAVYRTEIPTTTVSPGSAQGTTFSSLISGGTYYFRIWTKDRYANYSSLSSGATTWASILILDIQLSTNLLNLGPLTAGTTVVYHSSITVTNNGNAPVAIKLSVTDPTVWRSTDNFAGLDSFRLTGIFKDTKPNSGDFDVANDFINTSTHTATSTIYAHDIDSDSEKGINVPSAGQRALWFRIEMPRVSTTDAEQVIRLNASSQ